MSKAEVNQEVVKMRKFVRMARVRIIRSLVREIKILDVKRGDEKKLIKFKRRASRFREEVEAARKIKEDEVTNFGLTNTRSLYSILDDPTSDARTRVMAKFSDFVELKQRIAQCKEKFPHCEKFLGPGKKALARLEYEKRAQFIEEKKQKQIKEKEERKKLKEAKANSSENDSDNEMEVDSEISEKEEEEEGEESEEVRKYEDSEEIDEDSESESHNTNSKNNLKTKSRTENTSESESEEKLMKQVPKSLKNEQTVLKSKANKRKLAKSESQTEEKEPVKEKSDKKVSKPSKNTSSKVIFEKIAPLTVEPERKNKLDTKEIKVVTKEATVKKFSELLQEERAKNLEKEIEEISTIKSESKTQQKEVIKEVDNFFMTADGNQEYLRVVVPKKIESNNFLNDNEDYANDKNNTSFTSMNSFQEQPDKFRGDKNISNSKFGQRMEKRGYDRSNPRNKNANSTFGSRMEKRRGNEDRSAEKFNKFQKKTPVLDEQLHPSWAAKKKQQDALKLGFQGKKIVFDN